MDKKPGTVLSPAGTTGWRHSRVLMEEIRRGRQMTRQEIEEFCDVSPDVARYTEIAAHTGQTTKDQSCPYTTVVDGELVLTWADREGAELTGRPGGAAMR